MEDEPEESKSRVALIAKPLHNQILKNREKGMGCKKKKDFLEQIPVSGFGKKGGKRIVNQLNAPQAMLISMKIRCSVLKKFRISAL